MVCYLHNSECCSDIHTYAITRRLPSDHLVMNNVIRQTAVIPVQHYCASRSSQLWYDPITLSGLVTGHAHGYTRHYYTPTLLCARITHFQPCTITQSSERISGQKLSISYLPGYWVFARILRFGPLPVLRRIENDQWASGVFNQRIASDYYIVTSYLNAINLLNYNDICLYKQYAILCQQNASAIRWSY